MLLLLYSCGCPMQVLQKTGVSPVKVCSHAWGGPGGCTESAGTPTPRTTLQWFTGPSGILPYGLTPLTLSFGVGCFLLTQHETSKLCENCIRDNNNNNM